MDLFSQIGWNFPSNNDGNIDGFNNSGLETYRGSPTKSLAREIIQNSLDAKLEDKNNPVKVKFKLTDYPVKDFPDYEKFIKIINKCNNFWHHIDKVRIFFENGLDLLGQETIPVLKISDYNTTGLTGSKKGHSSNWQNLIKSSGVSDKGYGAGGSFGIGKYAPFVCSELRTVFYSTLDKDNIKAFQGVAELVTHEKQNDIKTQGKGFYGKKEKNRPIHDFNEINNFFHREKIGTDIFIFAFKYVEKWKVKIIKSVLENFLVSIYNDKLIVEIGDEKINSNNLERLIEKYIVGEKGENNYYVDKYYKVLTSKDERKEFEKNNFQDLGKIKLLLMNKKDFPQRIAMVRSTGMKIFDKGSFRTPMPFAGVMIAEGKDINEFLRKIEPPSHDNWEPERHDKPKYAKKIRRKLYSWLNEKVNDIIPNIDVDKVDVDGMSQFLPDELDEFPLDDESINEEESSLDLKDDNSEKEVENKNDSTIPTKGTGAILDSDGRAGTRTEVVGTGKRNNKKGKQKHDKVNGDGEEGKKSTKNGKEDTFKRVESAIKNSRVICLNPDKGIYLANIIPGYSGKGIVHFNIVGEDIIEPVEIKKAKIKNNNKGHINIKAKGEIGPLEIKEDEKIEIVFHIIENERYSMEVDILGN